MWADAQVFNVTSILTNIAAMAALQTLRSVGARMTETQRQVSSGLRVQVAADNAAYWSISTTMRSDNMAISAVSDALGLGAAKLDTAYTGTEAVIEVLDEFKAKLVAAREALPDQSRSPDADVFLMTLDKASPDNFVRQAEQACAGKTTCRRPRRLG